MVCGTFWNKLKCFRCERTSTSGFATATTLSSNSWFVAPSAASFLTGSIIAHSSSSIALRLFATNVDRSIDRIRLSSCGCCCLERSSQFYQAKKKCFSLQSNEEQAVRGGRICCSLQLQATTSLHDSYQCYRGERAAIARPASVFSNQLSLF